MSLSLSGSALLRGSAPARPPRPQASATRRPPPPRTASRRRFPRRLRAGGLRLFHFSFSFWRSRNFSPGHGSVPCVAAASGHRAGGSSPAFQGLRPLRDTCWQREEARARRRRLAALRSDDVRSRRLCPPTAAFLARSRARSGGVGGNRGTGRHGGDLRRLRARGRGRSRRRLPPWLSCFPIRRRPRNAGHVPGRSSPPRSRKMRHASFRSLRGKLPARGVGGCWDLAAAHPPVCGERRPGNRAGRRTP